MKYFEFVNEMTKKVKMCFGKEVSVEVHKVVKNNSLEYDSLTIIEPGRNITPNFYLQNMYRKYVDGVGIDNLVSEIVQIYENGNENRKFENISLDYEACHENIIMRLVSLEKNKKMLEDVPYIPFLDMAVVFYYLVENDEEGIASIRITKEIISNWGTDIKELYTIASCNSKRIFKEKVMPISAVIGKYSADVADIGNEDFNFNYDGIYEPYVVTNNVGINGATVILYPDMLKEIAAVIGGDYYMLPSSIHEVLVISVNTGISEDKLKSMVEEVNQNCLLPDEYLSDSVYKYNLAYNSLEMIA